MAYKSDPQLSLFQYLTVLTPLIGFSKPINTLLWYFLYYCSTPMPTNCCIPLIRDVLSWYKYLVNNNLLMTWDNFTRALETRFGPSSYDNHQATLFKLCQTSTVTTLPNKIRKVEQLRYGSFPASFTWLFHIGSSPRYSTRVNHPLHTNHHTSNRFGQVYWRQTSRSNLWSSKAHVPILHHNLYERPNLC